MKCKLTVVTTTYNQEKFIEQCIKGVIIQKTNFNFQFIISDDNSTDNTKNIINEYQKQYPNLIKPIFREKNLGPMNNFINTLNEVHTEYVALCDGDDFWTDETKLQQQVDFLEKHKSYSICFHKVKIFFEDGSQKPILHPKNISSTLTINDIIKENIISANTVVYRWIYKQKDSFIKDFPKNIIPGDYYLHLMHANKGKIYFIDKQMSCYRRQNQGMWWMTSQPNLRDKFYLKNGESLLNFYEIVENKLNLDENDFRYTKEWVVTEILNAYFINHDYKRLKKFYKRCFNNYSYNFISYFKKMSLFNKIIYIVNTDPVYFIKKLKNRI